ncbi:MAG: nitroreductase [Alphaproteobacteria bacterium RIFCSPHIGHO2_12_FULL_63_12]|nr:MAG: nitroreductase [Alphaproteobacteria bacterium RIFCSPHIGHO2_12_FULL_63_12]
MTDFPATTLSALGEFIERDVEDMRARSRAFFEEMSRRRTVRDYRSDPIPLDIIENCIATAGRAPSGANHQPWHFAVVGDKRLKAEIRAAAEEEERAFYAGRAGDEWLEALKPLGTDPNKPFLEMAPWLIAVFAQKRGGVEPGQSFKNYYINESVGIACGLLLAALHHAGLATLTHTPNPMTFLSQKLGRPSTEKPYLLIVVGRPDPDAPIPLHALKKKRLADIMTVH